MNAQELRNKSDDELNKELLELSKEAFNLRMKNGTGQLSRPSLVQAVRKDIARVKTVINERVRKGS